MERTKSSSTSPPRGNKQRPKSGQNSPNTAHNNPGQQTGQVATKRTEVAAFAYHLLSFEMVNYFDQQADYAKMEAMGFTIGFKFAERFVRNHSKFASTLEVVKFLCKDLWHAMFGKHVDKLQTNHKGVFVLHDNTFAWVSHINVDYRSDESLDHAKKFLVIPCGLIRGALTVLGVKSTVRAEFATLPACFFNIQIQQELNNV